ncbi:flavo protein [Lepidopterella palustris CBS 459.81]|uniref:Flavo protein n=1 Tax=Lepidopterella palustris CBS 459.81 TaxID=1314670 RepID=A0A8E2JGE7_9PEZI|nr:flavo protein [Lepidopterella palustris CBS 459.81]
MPSVDNHHLNVLIASATSSTPEFTEDVTRRLSAFENVHTRTIVCLRHLPHVSYHFPLTSDLVDTEYYDDEELRSSEDLARDQDKVAELCAWADLLVLATIDADNLARMLHGMTNNLHLEILRSWDVSKKILLIPGMSTLMWENPMTKKQLSKIRRKWNWIRVLQPLLWSFEAKGRKELPWDGLDGLIESVHTQVDLMTVGRDVDVAMPHTPAFKKPRTRGPVLPPELWSIILDYTGDWELATALNVHTTVPTPPDWRQGSSEAGPQTYMEKLEWTLLVGTFKEARILLASEHPRRLSRLCIKLIMRFAMVRLLRHLETAHKELFWSTFGHAFLPVKASSVFGKVEILEYWRTSPSFLSKEYSAEAMDNASRAGFVHVLDWWYNSGLSLKYSEAALEQASSQGHIAVLEWWKNHGLQEGDARNNSSNSKFPQASSEDEQDASPFRSPLRLKVGKSISYATQSGSLPTLRWWSTSGIPFPHEDSVAKLASTHGHVKILDFWRKLRGEKMLFDNQVLVGATKMGHADVLEWWKRSGLRVEYKTCDIEEALEDGVEGDAGEKVRRWWARNGLNLGVGTSEWMRTKILDS